MLDALRSSQTAIYLGATALTLVAFALLVLALRAFLRLGRRVSTRRTFSDLPDLIHGPQEMPERTATSVSVD